MAILWKSKFSPALHGTDALLAVDDGDDDDDNDNDGDDGDDGDDDVEQVQWEEGLCRRD